MPIREFIQRNICLLEGDECPKKSLDFKKAAGPSIEPFSTATMPYIVIQGNPRQHQVLDYALPLNN